MTVFLKCSNTILWISVFLECWDTSSMRSVSLHTDTRAEGEVVDEVQRDLQGRSDPEAGGVAAHAYFPPIGDVHIDADEKNNGTFHNYVCGTRDDDDVTESRLRRYVTSGKKWATTSLKYKFGNYYPFEAISKDKQRSTMRQAFRLWTRHCPLSITETTGKADILIKFEKRYHGDADPFDGPGGVAAHAYFPPIGDVHFDADEKFTVDSYTGLNLYYVAVHEIGHTLGLAHSKVQGSIMARQLSEYTPNLKLHPDDIAGIQAIYGDPQGIFPSSMALSTNTLPASSTALATSLLISPTHSSSLADDTGELSSATTSSPLTFLNAFSVLISLVCLT